MLAALCKDLTACAAARRRRGPRQALPCTRDLSTRSPGPARLGILRQNLRFILRNPIYTGWKVYDTKRDPSPQGYVPSPNGRQGYRKKIRRKKDEVIRKKVREPLISEEAFALAQQIIELRSRSRSEARRKNPGRFTYLGFLTCGTCSDRLYMWAGHRDFYSCKSHAVREKRKRALDGLSPCANKFMLREKLEPKIDHVLASKLCDHDFLSQVIDKYNEHLRSETRDATVDQAAIADKISVLTQKKRRILETFFDGLIPREERDLMVRKVENEIGFYQDLMLQLAGDLKRQPELDPELAMDLIQPFADWEFLNRADRRSILGMLCCRIRVFRYEIKDVTLSLPRKGSDSYKDSHLKTTALVTTTHNLLIPINFSSMGVVCQECGRACRHEVSHTGRDYFVFVVVAVPLDLKSKLGEFSEIGEQTNALVTDRTAGRGRFDMNVCHDGSKPASTGFRFIHHVNRAYLRESKRDGSPAVG
jgi:Recombinase